MSATLGLCFPRNTEEQHLRSTHQKECSEHRMGRREPKPAIVDSSYHPGLDGNNGSRPPIKWDGKEKE